MHGCRSRYDGRNGGTGGVADQEKIGKPWRDDELDAIVADYFAMLDAELHGRHYVKARHSAALMQRIGRTHRSVEFKHQNISAVLEELGMPWIPGYKPKRNYQGAVFGAIDRYLTTHGDTISTAVAPPAATPMAEDRLFVDPPPLGQPVQRPPQLERLVRKFAPVERDFRNRSLGEAGEAFVLEVEQHRLHRFDRPDLAKKVRWVSKEDDGAGYDILSYEPASGDRRLIEVKTTNGPARTSFFLTRVEHETASLVRLDAPEILPQIREQDWHGAGFWLAVERELFLDYQPMKLRKAVGFEGKIRKHPFELGAVEKCP